MLNSKVLFCLNILIISFLLITISSAIKLVESYTSITTQESFRLIPGTEYRFQKYSTDLRIFYSSAGSNDLFLPLKTQAEWTAFFNYHPSTIEITTLTCSIVGTTNWNPYDIYDCSGSNKRCYGGVCRTCGGVMASDGCSGCASQGGNACWRAGGSGESCTTVCGSYGGCIAKNWNDNGCVACRAHFGSSLACSYESSSASPHRYYRTGTNTWGNGWTDHWCRYRGAAPGYSVPSQSCGSGVSYYSRVCVCNY
jgi:hypothetical protein